MMKKHTCLVIGDLMLDEYIYGDVERVSPEAPVPVVRVKERKSVLGGAANVAAGIAAMDCDVVLIGVLGKDANAEKIKVLTSKHKIRNCSIAIESRVTTVKTRIIGNGNQVVRYDDENTSELLELEENQLITAIEQNMNSVDIVVISDYAKGVCTERVCQFVIKLGKEQGKKVLVDPKISNWSRYEGAYLIKPNRKEFEIVQCDLVGEISDNSKAKILMDKYKISNILLTKSQDGMILFQTNETVGFPTKAREVFDVSGAGDTVIATLASFFGENEDLITAIEYATLAAGIAVGKSGTYIVSYDELINEVAHGKYLSENGFLDEIMRLKQKGKKIVFTNGCFDILHVGHIEVLKQAKKLGDVLVVGLNSDESVKRLKGDERPINCETDRCKMLLALRDVDYVQIFQEDTPYELIRKVQPDILVKGGDYKIEEIVGHTIVKETIVIPYVDGKSTTGIINKIEKKEIYNG